MTPPVYMDNYINKTHTHTHTDTVVIDLFGQLSLFGLTCICHFELIFFLFDLHHEH